MKKIRYPIIAVLATMVLAACGSRTEPTTPETTTPPASIAPVTPNNAPPETTVPEQDELSPTVLVDNDQVCVKITGTEVDPIWGYTLNVYLENKTDKELMFTVDNVAINRYMCDPFWAESVAPGMKSHSSISWFDSNLKENSISDVQEISFTLRVYDSNDFFAEDILQESFTVTP